MSNIYGYKKAHPPFEKDALEVDYSANMLLAHEPVSA